MLVHIRTVHTHHIGIADDLVIIDFVRRAFYGHWESTELQAQNVCSNVRLSVRLFARSGFRGKKTLHKNAYNYWRHQLNLIQCRFFDSLHLRQPTNRYRSKFRTNINVITSIRVFSLFMSLHAFASSLSLSFCLWVFTSNLI